MKNFPAFVLLGTLGCGALAIADDDHPEVLVARSQANQLIAHIHFAQPVELPRSVFPGVPGFATPLMGFASLGIDDPEEGLFVLAPSARITAIVTAIDPGARLDDGPVTMAPGGVLDFFNNPFDYHPIFSIPSPAASFGDAFSLRFVLRDITGLYADSEEFTLTITPQRECDSIDFNRDTLSPDSGDLDDFLAVLAGGPGACSTAPLCGDIDFNNDTFAPDSLDLDAFLSRLAGGACL